MTIGASMSDNRLLYEYVIATNFFSPFASLNHSMIQCLYQNTSLKNELEWTVIL